MLKKCRTCLIDQPIVNFHRVGEDRKNHCKKCTSLRTKEYGKRLDVKLKKRIGHLRRLYGLSLEDYDLMYKTQNGLCKICENAFEVLHVDHNHQTGQVRGLLCKDCNVKLAVIENKEFMNNANIYLKEKT